MEEEEEVGDDDAAVSPPGIADMFISDLTMMRQIYGAHKKEVQVRETLEEQYNVIQEKMRNLQIDNRNLDDEYATLLEKIQECEKRRKTSADLIEEMRVFSAETRAIIENSTSAARKIANQAFRASTRVISKGKQIAKNPARHLQGHHIESIRSFRIAANTDGDATSETETGRYIRTCIPIVEDVLFAADSIDSGSGRK